VKEVESDIFAIARRKLLPLDAMLEVTYRCNLSCVHCFIEENTHEELSTREIFDLLDQLAAAGTLTVTLTGGEALTREDFFDIAAYARHKAMAVNLMSNGTLIDDAAGPSVGMVQDVMADLPIVMRSMAVVNNSPWDQMSPQ
jgi:MoaA/NifB/PqqE/SkfB family radical SAM enzyme